MYQPQPLELAFESQLQLINSFDTTTTTKKKD
jgi:hypothetical protein